LGESLAEGLAVLVRRVGQIPEIRALVGLGRDQVLVLDAERRLDLAGGQQPLTVQRPGSRGRTGAAGPDLVGNFLGRGEVARDAHTALKGEKLAGGPALDGGFAQPVHEGARTAHESVQRLHVLVIIVDRSVGPASK
jgi:hypothetical protein